MLAVRNGNLTKLCRTFAYFKTLKGMGLRNNNITRICKSFAETLEQGYLEINKKSKLEMIWLSENPFHCDCSMTWMIGWLNNFTTPDKQHIIRDYQQIRCHTGLMKEKPIFVLNAVDMGCFPSKWTIWQKVGVGLGAGVAGLVILGLTALVIKRSRDIQFFFYYYFKWCTCFGVPRDDKKEKVQDLLHDAYLSYR